MKNFDPRAFAERWVADWNKKDVEAVLAHFTDDCLFVSPKAAAIVGDGRVEGKDALRDYWTRAVAKFPKLEFRLEDAVWNAEARTLFVIYEARLDGGGTRALEVMRFDTDGKVERGEAFYGAPIIATI